MLGWTSKIYYINSRFFKKNLSLKNFKPNQLMLKSWKNKNKNPRKFNRKASAPIG